MIHPLQVHQLMDQDIVPHPFRHQQETPVQADVPVPAAGSPPRPLIPNADSRHPKTMELGQCQQAWREIVGRLFPERRRQVNGRPIDPIEETCALTNDPCTLRAGEFLRVTLRPPARDGDPQAAIGVHAQDVPPGAAVADVVHVQVCG